jgi:hypothetical protein
MPNQPSWRKSAQPRQRPLCSLLKIRNVIRAAPQSVVVELTDRNSSMTSINPTIFALNSANPSARRKARNKAHTTGLYIPIPQSASHKHD